MRVRRFPGLFTSEYGYVRSDGREQAHLLIYWASFRCFGETFVIYRTPRQMLRKRPEAYAGWRVCHKATGYSLLADTVHEGRIVRRAYPTIREAVEVAEWVLRSVGAEKFSAAVAKARHVRRTATEAAHA